MVATDAEGNVRTVSVAQNQTIDVDTTPQVDKTAAAATAREALTEPAEQQEPRLVVHALSAPRLAWETLVSGRDHDNRSAKKVYVDAHTGARFDEQETIFAGSGTGIWSGGGLTIGTTQSGSSYTMRDPARPGISCADYNTGQVYTDADNTWGSTSKTDKVAGCVDVMYTAAGQWDVLKSLGRTGLNNSGQWAPAKVGLDDRNAFWQNNEAAFGYNNARQWITGIDVVAHEFGHGLDQYTPGGISGGGTAEFVGDVWGATVEHYLNNATDTPDYTVGEMVNLVGQGPIRNMYDPSKVSGDPNCYSSSVPGMEVHKAAGPGNHWFYLLAEGSNPGGGKPASPTCNGSTLTGIGITNAAKIFYNAMMLKTSGMGYGRYRTLTLTAAKNLDSSCGWYTKVKQAWDAVSLGAQSGEPSCQPTGSDFSLSLSANAGSVKPGESVQATVNTTITSGSAQNVSLSASFSPANAGLSASFNPAQIQSGNTSAVTIAANSSVPAGNYTVTVTGAGSVTRTATYALTVSTGPGNPGTAPDISVDNVKAHLQQFQTFATNNGGNRRSTGPGYTASVSYVEQKLRDAGFTVSRQNCTSGCTSGSGPNLIADWPGGSPDTVYMFGAHLDGVAAGPGINDNGTGSAALLEVALKLAQTKPTMLNHLRFGWWTDEEQGLNGSKFYVNQLPSAERSKIKGYFNFDMVGSPNPGYFIDNLTTPLSANLKGFFDSISVVPDEMGECCSDDGPFRDAGIPTTFLSTGASATKTSAQAAKWGGTAGQAFDSCYHRACDSYPSNVNTTALDRAADAIAWAAWKVAVGTDPTPADDFSIASNPSSGSVLPGGSATATVNTAVIKGATQPVVLTASVSPGGPAVTFDPSTVDAGESSNLTVATAAGTPAGTYTVTITGTGKRVTHTTTFTLTVQGTGTDDFSVAVNPNTGTVQAGGSATATVNTAVTSGATQPVTFTASVSPAGPTVTFDPPTVDAGETVDLTVATTADTPAGTYTVTITGTGKRATHTTTFTLTVERTGGGRTFTNDSDFGIWDYQRTVSTVTSNASGPAATTVTLTINVQHTCAEDLGISLIGPNGLQYGVKRSGGYVCTPWNGPMTFTVPGVSSAAAGTWQLWIYDYGPGDIGILDSWSVTV